MRKFYKISSAGRGFDDLIDHLGGPVTSVVSVKGVPTRVVEDPSSARGTVLDKVFGQGNWNLYRVDRHGAACLIYANSFVKPRMKYLEGFTLDLWVGDPKTFGRH